MRFHRHLCESVVEILSQIFSDKYYADKVIERQFKINKKWGKRDREFVAQTTYEIVRWWRLYWHLIGKDISNNKNDFWDLVAVHYAIVGVELPDWLGKFRHNSEELKKKIYEIKNLALKNSLPDWIVEEAESQKLNQASEIFQQLNKIAPLIIRANTLKTTRDELKKKIADKGILLENHLEASDALIFKEKHNVFSWDEFKEGLFEVQDGNSQLITEFCKVNPGEFVIDACAGAGGKTLGLAAKMKNKGKLIALDIHSKKLAELKIRLKRAGVDNVEVRLIDSGKVIKRLADKADVLLLDVPCSGLGVLRRNPDSKWKLSLNRLRELEKIQFEILTHYTSMLKSGGRLIYSTCSLFPSENQGQINNFLNSEKGSAYKLKIERTILPSDSGADGFYMAQLIKN